MTHDQPKIAIASSGLGHIRRGIETWAYDLAHALQRRGQEVTLFQGAGAPETAWQLSLPCFTRFDDKTERWVRRMRKLGGWRYGFGSGYELEQTTFTLALWRNIRRDYDILHVQDPWIALLMERLYRLRLSRPRVILAHGTEEPTAFLRKFSNLQHLAPCYLEDWKPNQPPNQKAFAIGNFVQTETFRPGDKAAARREWEIEQDTFVVLCVAAIKAHHKRVDSLIREVAALKAQTAVPVLLIVAGAREAETDAIRSLGESLLGESVRFLEGVSRDRIPALYRAADVFALASLHEMMPIAVLEALSSGLPVACNATPTLHWMAGPGGRLNDLNREGALAEQLLRLTEPEIRAKHAAAARRHAEVNFSEEAVARQILAMYAEVLR